MADERNPLLAVGDKMEVAPIAAEDNAPLPSSTHALHHPNHATSSTSSTSTTSSSTSTSKTRLPQAIAHRGYKAAHPENTMGAFKGAISVGAHAIETDLHITKDGIIVLSHDATLKRCFGLEDKIIDCEWAFLETLETLREPRERMPRLRDLLEFLATEGGEDVWVLLDIKMDNDAEDIIRLIASTIKEVPPSSKKPWNQRIVLGCWAAKYIPLCQTHLPTYPITHIGFSISYARKFLTPDLPNVSFNMLQKILVGPFGSSFLRDVKRAQRSVFVWTVNEVGWMRWCVRKEVDGVVTDDPKLFLEVCRRWVEEGEKKKVGDDGKVGIEGKGRKGDGVGVRDYLSVVWIHVLVVFLGWLFWWRNAGKEGGGGGKERRRRNGRIAL